MSAKYENNEVIFYCDPDKGEKMHEFSHPSYPSSVGVIISDKNEKLIDCHIYCKECGELKYRNPGGYDNTMDLVMDVLKDFCH